MLLAIKRHRTDAVKFILKQPNLPYPDILSAHNYAMHNHYTDKTIQDALQDHVNWIDSLIKNEKMAIPHGYMCPITLGLIMDPAISPDGRIYEKEAIKQWVTKYSTSPVARQFIQLDQLNPCLHIRDEIKLIINKMELSQEYLTVSNMMLNNAHHQSRNINAKVNQNSAKV